jgi:myosin-5
MSKLLSENRIQVFIPDENYIWVTAEVVSEAKAGGFTQYDVEITDQEVLSRTKMSTRTLTVKCSPGSSGTLPLQNEGLSEFGVNDMCALNYLHDASILDNLRRRFKSRLPYTYTGEICIALNPYQWLDIYTDPLKDSHLSALRHEIDPHVYSTSSTAYRGILPSTSCIHFYQPT